MVLSERMLRLARVCVDNREAHTWLGLSDKPVTQQGANKFFLGAIIDYQIKAEKAWSKAAWLADVHFLGTINIWAKILEYSDDEWLAFCKANSVHRFPKAFERIQRIGKIIQTEYHGDAREIWDKAKASVVRNRLMNLSLGQQITNMVLGALFDSSLIKGPLDVKADIHVTRVLGRALIGSAISINVAIELSRDTHPSNPWLLDAELFRIGKTSCHKSNPQCALCKFREFCLYYSQLLEADESGE